MFYDTQKRGVFLVLSFLSPSVRHSSGERRRERVEVCAAGRVTKLCHVAPCQPSFPTGYPKVVSLDGSCRSIPSRSTSRVPLITFKDHRRVKFKRLFYLSIYHMMELTRRMIRKEMRNKKMPIEKSQSTTSCRGCVVY